MKKVLISLCIFLSLSISSVWAGDEKVKPIEITKGETVDHNEDRPRDLLQVPITCMYQDGFLCFTFYEDLGELEITVTNQSTGATTTYPYDAASGSVVVGVSNESAPYLIEIETISGDCYWGEYTL